MYWFMRPIFILCLILFSFPVIASASINCELGWLKIWDSGDKVVQIWGTPTSVKERSYKNRQLKYRDYNYNGGLEVVLLVRNDGNSGVAAVITAVNTVPTDEGIRVGDSVQTLLNTYPELKRSSNNSYYYYTDYKKIL